MRFATPIQLVGSCVVALSIACAEMIALALDRFPGSALLWRLNLEVFRVFQTFAMMSEGVGFAGIPGNIVMCAPALGLLCIYLAVRSQLALALAVHFSAALLAVSTATWLNSHGKIKVAGLYAAIADQQPAAMLVLSLATLSALSVALSHAAFIAKFGKGQRPE
jgi:hypothetical protein